MYKIGVDIGGTFVKYGLLDETGNILKKRSFPFPGPDPRVLVDTLRRNCILLLEERGIGLSDVSVLGVIVPGSISSDGGTVLDAHNLGYHDVPLRRILEETFPECRLLLRNDADGAAIGELYCGALKGCRTGVMMTLGTGVGGGIIMNGRLYKGGTGQGVELGHMLLVDGGVRCSCGRRGCVEAYCSATALAELGKTACRSNPAGKLAERLREDPAAFDAKTVVDCAKAGDPDANDAFDEYLGRLSSACASLFTLLDPEVLVIGGGLSAAGDFLFEPLKKQLDQKIFFRSHGQLLPAQHGNDAGIVGSVIADAD